MIRNKCGTKRNPIILKAKVGQTIFVNMLCLALFWDLRSNTFKEQMGLAGFLFFVCIFTLMNNMQGALLTF